MWHFSVESCELLQWSRFVVTPVTNYLFSFSSWFGFEFNDYILSVMQSTGKWTELITSNYCTVFVGIVDFNKDVWGGQWCPSKSCSLHCSEELDCCWLCKLYFLYRCFRRTRVMSLFVNCNCTLITIQLLYPRFSRWQLFNFVFVLHLFVLLSNGCSCLLSVLPYISRVCIVIGWHASESL